MKVYYLPLEPYEERYTLQLLDWTVSRFDDFDIDYHIIEGVTLAADKHIHTGVVLDVFGRNYYALSQMMALVEQLAGGQISSKDVIYIQDMYHPGWEAMPYILDQVPVLERLRIYTLCFAQSVDIYDFTYPMRRWMRHYEMLVDKTVSGIFVASSCLAELLRTAGLQAPIHLVGLPFDKNEVCERAGYIPSWHERSKRIVYTSRWDWEKQPWFFMDLVQSFSELDMLKDYEFAICTGAKQLRSNSPELVSRALKMQDDGLLSIYHGLSKADYYNILANSRLQFNCALQDFVSNTLNEASALGTPSLLPAFRSFPEALDCQGCERHLFMPWSLGDAMSKMLAILSDPDLSIVSYSADKQHKTLDHIMEILGGTDGGRYKYPL